MMFHSKSLDRNAEFSMRSLAALFFFIAFTAVFVLSASAAGVKQKGFATPDDAAQALVNALKSHNNKELSAIFGSETKGLISSGDPVADKANADKFVKSFEETHQIKMRSPEVAIIHIGSQDFPFPIPLVKDGNAWYFDTKAGREEIINRRIGRNELNTIDVLRACVDAQRDYFERKLGEGGSSEYARRIASSKGKKDGLYWEVKEGEEESPLGPLVATAAEEGYVAKKNRQIPFHGYYFRILTGQGSHAPGGAKQYIVNGRMTGGFALVAHPAQYGSSGIMTFIVNQDGIIYQKDLGARTAVIAKSLKLFDPDTTWQVVTE
jgi:hypothetical protein